MAATVYIIRHAEAEGNIYRRCHGLYDSLLTPRAYQQLPCLAKRFENVPLAAVYALRRPYHRGGKLAVARHECTGRPCERLLAFAAHAYQLLPQLLQLLVKRRSHYPNLPVI